MTGVVADGTEFFCRCGLFTNTIVAVVTICTVYCNIKYLCLLLTQCVSLFLAFLITNGSHFPTQQQVIFLSESSKTVLRAARADNLQYASLSPQKPKLNPRALLDRVCGGQSGIGLDIPLSTPAFPCQYCSIIGPYSAVP
jgi:hypothetical protein